MRILVISQFYPPEPAALIHELAQTLGARGHHVTVLTGFPNYPSGKLAPGYRLRLWMRETRDGIPVLRVPLYPNHGRSGILRALNYLSFAFSCTLLAPFLLSKADAIFVYHPPLTVAIPAWILSRLWGVPFLYQIQDMWPETLRATGMLDNQRILDWIGRFATQVYACAAAICVISPGFRDNLLAKGVPAGKIHVIPNWVDSDTYFPDRPDPQVATELGLAGKFNIMFAGNMGKAQALGTVLDAAQALQDRPDLQFVLVGDGLELAELQADAKRRQLTNVRFLGRYPAASMPALYALADLLLVHLKDDPLFRITIPHKILAYLASGKPVLAAVAGDAADLVTRAGAGIACAPEDPRALALAVRELMALPESERLAMGRHGLAAAHREFGRDVSVEKIELVLQSLVNGRSAVGDRNP